MNIVKATVFSEYLPPRSIAYSIIESAGRTCYRSDPQEGDTTKAFIRRAIQRGHWSILEHVSVTLRFICDRGVSHELVRHRIASYSQESTRYCNYSRERFGSEITVIRPCYLEPGTEGWRIWEESCEASEKAYFDLLGFGLSPQEARGVLPHSLKTEVVSTMNLREWHHFLEMRYIGVAGTPHPQMVEVAKQAFNILYSQYPVIFEDIKNL